MANAPSVGQWDAWTVWKLRAKFLNQTSSDNEQHDSESPGQAPKSIEIPGRPVSAAILSWAMAGPVGSWRMAVSPLLNRTHSDYPLLLSSFIARTWKAGGVRLPPPKPACAVVDSVAPRDIEAFGPPFVRPPGALIARRQKRSGAKNRALQPFAPHRSSTSSLGDLRQQRLARPGRHQRRFSQPCELVVFSRRP
jgi:hypothetical protein